ncbi:MAG: hypothetical protein K8S13_01450, partial [Desulfobacula sp.]|uniref:hypothetical protein n=1 Tax=Desulfobacula sp. TaxID=2593537 RepID=UPI0025C27ACB
LPVTQEVASSSLVTPATNTKGFNVLLEPFLFFGVAFAVFQYIWYIFHRHWIHQEKDTKLLQGDHFFD